MKYQARNSNKETLEAMKESKSISKDNNIKYYNTADEMIDDILVNEI